MSEFQARNLAEGGCLLSPFHFTLCRFFLGHAAYPGRASCNVLRYRMDGLKRFGREKGIKT